MIPFVTNYSPSAMILVRNIKNHFEHFQQDSQLLTDYRIIAAYRRNKNLKVYLVHAKLKPQYSKSQRTAGIL